jgi:SAM-dependent methyltransferase
MPETYERLKHAVGARKIVADWSLTKIEDTNLNLVGELPRSSNLDVLEVGAGRGYFCKRFTEKYPRNRYSVVEYEEANLEYGLRLEFYEHASLVSLGSVYSLPFESQQFDLVIASELLEHLQDLDVGLSEIDRVLRPDGYVIASAPSSSMYLHPLPILISTIQGLKHYGDENRGIRLLVKRLRRLADDNKDGAYHRPFLPSQFNALFKKRNYRIVRHVTSILYFFHPPFSTMIEAHPSSRALTLITKALVKASDSLLEANLPGIKWLGCRQHILAKKPR